MKSLKILLFFVLLWLQYSLWIGKNGCFDYIKIYQKVLIQKKNNFEIDIRNNKIILEIQDLNNHIKNF